MVETFIVVVVGFLVIYLANLRKSKKIAVKSSKKNQNQKNLPNKTFDEEENIDILQNVKVQKVIDGDTIVILKNNKMLKVRLDSIDCPEDGQEWGDIAKYGLIKLIGGKEIKIKEYGIDQYERILATVFVKQNGIWLNVNERMVALGHAWVMRGFYQHLPPKRKYALNRIEQWARSKKVGLWSKTNPIPPWEWRKKKCSNN